MDRFVRFCVCFAALSLVVVAFEATGLTASVRAQFATEAWYVLLAIAAFVLAFVPFLIWEEDLKSARQEEKTANTNYELDRATEIFLANARHDAEEQNKRQLERNRQRIKDHNEAAGSWDLTEAHIRRRAQAERDSADAQNGLR